MSAEHRLLVASLGLAFVIFLVALLTLPGTFGYGVLWFASIPMILTVIVWLLLRLSLALGHGWPRVIGIVICGIVCLGVVASFVIISFALLPNCALLIVNVRTGKRWRHGRTITTVDGRRRSASRITRSSVPRSGARGRYNGAQPVRTDWSEALIL